MQHNARIRAQLDMRKTFHPLPRDFYVDQDFYEADIENLFHREWIFVGHSFELPDAGCYMTLQIGNYPILVIRGKDGTIRALHNVCRHRGSKVCDQGSGRVSRLVCPYHQWSYRLDGSLSFARLMGNDFDKTLYGLKAAHCEVVDSFIFVCVAANPRNFNAFREQLSPYLRPHNLEQAKVAHETNIVEQGNWKLVFENNRECYHCEANHPQLMRTFVEDKTVAGVEAGEVDSATSAYWRGCAASGFPSALRLARDGQYRIVRIPLAEGAYSYTMSGKPAVTIPLHGRSDAAAGCEGRGIGVLLMCHYPSVWTHVLADYAVSSRVLPIDANTTLLTTKWLVNSEAEEGRDYDLEELTHVWTHTNAQDKQIIERAAQGVSSPAFEPGPFSPEMEAGPNQFVDWYCRFMARNVN